MHRLSIEVTTEQHQRLKAVAALSGKTLKDYVLERTLPSMREVNDMDETKALRQLEAFLKPRMIEAVQGKATRKSVRRIFEEVRRERKT